MNSRTALFDGGQSMISVFGVAQHSRFRLSGVRAEHMGGLGWGLAG